MISVGTSGFSYSEWKGVFYPEKMTQKEFLSHYSQYFDTCELNFSYYRMPERVTFQRMLDKSGGKISFSVKAFQDITHKPQCPSEIIKQFRDSLLPLRASGRLASVLFQFPYSFKDVSGGTKFISSLADRFQSFPVVVEFRNSVWADDRVFSFLRDNNVGYVCVDEPRLRGLMPPAVVATSSVSYVRFHGRNSAKWWEHDNPAERYDYLYSDNELSEWVPRIKELERKSETTLVYMNNHFRGNAVRNAQKLKEMLTPD